MKYNEFNINRRTNTIEACPNNSKPIKSYYNEGKKTSIAEFSRDICDICNRRKECLSKLKNNKYILKASLKALCLDSINNKKEQNENNFMNESNKLCNVVLSDDYYFRIFQRASDYLRLGEKNNYEERYLLEAEKLLYVIFNANRVFPFSSSIYLNLAGIKMLRFLGKINNSLEKDEQSLFNIEREDEIETLYNRVLEIEPTNQIAMAGLSKYYFYMKEYDKLYSCYTKITDNSQKEDVVQIFNVDYRYVMAFNSNIAFDKLVSKDLLELYQKLFDRETNSKCQIAIGNNLGGLYYSANKSIEGYNLSLSLIKRFPNLFLGYELACSFCGLSPLKKFVEAIEYGNKALELIEATESGVLSGYDFFCGELGQHKLSITSSIAMAYSDLNRFEDAIKLLKGLVKESPNNCNFTNLASVYYRLEEYNLALDMVNRALYYYEDEVSFTLLGKIYRKLGDFDRAIEYQKKGIYFIENENLNLWTFKDNIFYRYFSSKEESNTIYEELYDDIIVTYINKKDFISAFTLNQIAKEKFGRIERFIKSEDILKNFIDIEKESLEINNKLYEIESERQKEREIYQNKILAVRDWVTDLLRIQSDIDESAIFDIDSEEFWLNYEVTMDLILEKMKLYARQAGISYIAIEDKFKAIFPGLSNKALKCLSTAEYLFEVNKNNFIDFAPIVVEYSKVFEIEINNVFNFSPNKTLGSLVFTIKEANIRSWSSIVNELEKVRIIRNGSAHTGLSTLEKVEKIREIIFDEQTLNFVIKEKQRINSKSDFK